MAKVKIINSDSLEYLKRDILIEIEFADAQISSYQDEIDQEKQHKQDEKTITALKKLENEWWAKRNTLHQCLCKIHNSVKEIEI